MQAVQWELAMGVRVCEVLAQPDPSQKGRPQQFLLGWYLQQCTDLAMLLLGRDPKDLMAPCTVQERRAGGAVSRELVRLAPPSEGEADLVVPKPLGCIEGGSSVPYTTEICDTSSCLALQDAKTVDTVVRMFMLVICSEDIVDAEDGSMILALWEDVQDCLVGAASGEGKSELVI
jgi:hypothetical protein